MSLWMYSIQSKIFVTKLKTQMLIWMCTAAITGTNKQWSTTHDARSRKWVWAAGLSCGRAEAALCRRVRRAKPDVLWVRWSVRLGVQASYLLLSVGFRPPAPNSTCPASIDCSQVLPSTLFTIQFNHTLEGGPTIEVPQRARQNEEIKTGSWLILGVTRSQYEYWKWSFIKHLDLNFCLNKITPGLWPIINQYFNGAAIYQLSFSADFVEHSFPLSL